MQNKIDEQNLIRFMKARQLKIGRSLNIFDYLEAVSEFYQTVENHDDSIDDETFKRNKAISKQTFTFAIATMREFGITEKDGYLIDYFKME